MDTLQRIESERSVTILADGVKILDRLAKVCVPLFEMDFSIEDMFGTELAGLMTHYHSIRTATDQLRTELRQIQNAGFKARIRAIEGKIDKSEAELRQATSVLAAYLAKDNVYTERLDEIVIPSTFYQDEQNNGGFTPLVDLNSTLHALLQLHKQHTLMTPEAEAAKTEQTRALELQEKNSSGELEQLKETLTNAKHNLNTTSNTFDSTITSLKDSISNLETFKTQTETQLSDKLTSTLEISSKQYTAQMEDQTMRLTSISKELSTLRYNTNTSLASLNRSLARQTTSMTELTNNYDETCLHATDVITLLTHRARLIQKNINLLNEHIEEYNKWWSKVKAEEDKKKEVQRRKQEGTIAMDEAGSILEAAWKGYKFRLCGGIDKARKDAKKRAKKSRGARRGSRDSRSNSKTLRRARSGSSTEDSYSYQASTSSRESSSAAPKRTISPESKGDNYDDVVNVE